MIILDLRRVGSEQGSNLALVEEVVERTDLEVLAGAEYATWQILEALKEIGFSRALVATALHKGIITPETLKTNGCL